MEWHALDKKEVLKELGSSEEGLSEQEASTRLAAWGQNIVKTEKKISRLKVFISQFKSAVVYVLLGAFLISIFIQEYLDATFIAGILLLNGIFGFFQEYKAEKAVEELRKLITTKAKVFRDGRKKVIDASFLVPGDVIELEAGDKIPADSRLLMADEFATQESALTGESTNVAKNSDVIKQKVEIAEMRNMAFLGTIAVKGKALGVVTETGMKTEIGKVANMIQEIDKVQTPLQDKVEHLGKVLSVSIVFIAIFVFLVGLLRSASIPSMLLISLSLAVAAIPEGLVVVMTISLALGVQRMSKRNAIVRRLASVETLGETNVICADKTGTLTKNEMTVRKIFVNTKTLEVTGTGYETRGDFFYDGTKKQISSGDRKALELLFKIGVLCNNASIKDNVKLSDTKSETFGDPTELALLVSAEKANLFKEQLEKENPRVKEIFFTSERKRMTTINSGRKKTAFVKGAPEVILNLCTRIYENGQVRMIQKEDHDKLLKINDKFAHQALRVLAFAYRDLENREAIYSEKSVERELIFVGLQAMQDPPREEVKASIETCKNAGINVVMITGDHAKTAAAIASELGINGKFITGQDLEKMDDDELYTQVEEISIYARVNPIQKTRIVEAWQRKGKIVAMTGDGINDAPALKKANIGIAIGSGTDVAKEASDMILVDDNFASIVNAIEEGRGIYDNIKKFVNYLLSANFAEVLIIFLAILLGFEFSGKIAIPLLATQLLWINIVTDSLPALALGVDPISKDIMKRKPRQKNEPIVSRNMLLHIIFIGVIMSALILYIFKANLQDIVRAQTIAFTTLVLFEFARVYMIRANYKTPLLSNRFLIISIIIGIVLQLAVIYSPASAILKTTPLELEEWKYILGATLIFTILGFSLNTIIKKISGEGD